MKRENMFLILLLLFLSVPWSSQEEATADGSVAVQCTAEVLEERAARMVGNITITVT